MRTQNRDTFQKEKRDEDDPSSILPVLDVLLEFLLVAFLADLVLTDGGDCRLKLADLLVFECIVGVLLVELLDQLPQVFLLLLYIDVVALQVLVLLLCQYAIQFLIQVLYCVLNLTVETLNFAPMTQLAVTITSKCGLSVTQ